MENRKAKVQRLHCQKEGIQLRLLQLTSEVNIELRNQVTYSPAFRLSTFAHSLTCINFTFKNYLKDNLHLALPEAESSSIIVTGIA